MSRDDSYKGAHHTSSAPDAPAEALCNIIDMGAQPFGPSACTQRARRRMLYLISCIQIFLYERPIAQRHRIAFYMGHLEAFDRNLLAEVPADRGTAGDLGQVICLWHHTTRRQTGRD